MTMMASNAEMLTRRPPARRRRNSDRRTRVRLRELCEEVLASYRLAQGQDIVTAEDREQATQLLRKVTPAIAR